MQPTNQDRFNRLKTLSPIDAVQAWIEGAFGIGDEPALLAAIRRDPRVRADDNSLCEALGDAMDEGLDPRACLERLASLS